MGKYQLLPPLSDADYTALKKDIAQRGVIVAIEYDEDGEIIDGYHRAKICEELNITVFPKVVRSYANDQEKRSQARRLNVLRRHMDSKARREVIEAELAESPDRSDRQVAESLGVSKNTVAKAREAVGQNDQPKAETRKGKDGKNYKATKPKKPKKEKAPPAPDLPPQPSNIDPFLSCLGSVRALVFECLPDIPPDRWPELIAELHCEVDRIEQTIETRKAGTDGHHAARQSA
jgi:ParB-like chromosome segregation protein Spo0J